ncbi:T7SS effector LXG polymorphic toxin [Enterococcus caccae]|uniref:LXG domain-containing protein n=1 Tax=Enterococcus caccae ATCC BAA-1240 TaxID=1158612 RepID=R3WTD9_9ENTE|nr:T7SS effector LXG polymorphic toxin [Enterococcus caccae]EOL45075.1 hypothetical protein UC7_01881 [Enterococcus caccae ATCC BAA-1240]EOT58482.1 hypothetical protein I580_02653 [Enterococcus caccae ATCC BAA-1240]OJG27189.1 hypothetical protein RU98_GL002969 [Enterococcus caccae]
MGFHVETAEMKKALEQYQKLSRTVQEQLDNAKSSMNGIINSNAMHGQVGQAIAADINNNKNAVLVGLKNSYKLVEADLQKTYADFAGTTGETSQSAVLDEDVLTKAKTAIDKFKTEHKEKRQTIKSTYNDIADLISLSMPSSSTFTSACDEAKKQLDKIIQKVNEFDSKQPPSSAEEIINALSQQIKMSETASGVSYTDPRFMEFVSQTGLAESIQDIDSQIAKAEADAKLEAEKAAKEKQEQWAKDHPLENALRNFSDGIGSWWNGIVKGTKGLNTEGFFLLETGKGILLALESTVGFVGDGISSLAIGSVQVGQLLGGGIATGINNLRGVKSPDWIGKDWSGTVKNVQALTPSAIFEMSKAAIGAMADDFKRGDIYDMTTDVLTVGTMLTAANGLKNTAKNVTTKLKAPKVGSVVDDVAKGSSGAKSSGEDIFNYTNKVNEHMANPDRAVPAQTLKEAIKGGTPMPDPRGSSATMYYSEIYINGKKYNFEVLYDKATNTIYHFKYDRRPLGPLPAVPKQ